MSEPGDVSEAEEGRPVRVITFGKRQGGSGATTVSFNATLWMIRLAPPRGGRIYAYVEADFGRQSALWLFDPELFRRIREDPDSQPTLRHLLAGSASPRDLLLTSDRYPEYRHMAVVAAGPLTASDREILEDYETYLEKLDDLRDFLLSVSERVIVDGPGGGGLAGLRDYYLLIPLADLFVPVLEANEPSIAEIQALIDLTVTVETGYACYVVNKFEDRHTPILELVERELADSPGIRGFTVRYDELAKRTYDAGKPLALAAPGSPASQDIRKLAEFLLRLRVVEEPESPSEKGWRLLDYIDRILRRKISPTALFRPLRGGGLETEENLERIIREIEEALGG